MDTSTRTQRLEIIGSAAAGIAHDINNQLTLILNHLASPDMKPADVEGVKRAASRCSSLTASLLSWCRGESLAVRPLDSVPFLDDFIARLRLPAGIRLKTSLPAGLPRILVDSLSLERILTNLVSNACTAMQGSGFLRIAASPLRIEVGDSGPGIPPEMRSVIFQPFFTTRGAEGTGLGLAIVREIMRQNGGSVSVGSDPGGGACFVLRFRGAA
jgi:signal transduction histidine kinase